MSDERANTCGLTLCAKGRGRFAAIAEDGRLLAESHTPIFEAARVLQAQGVPGGTVLEVRQEGSPIISMRVTVAMAAALTVEEGPSGPRFRPHRPPPEDMPTNVGGGVKDARPDPDRTWGSRGGECPSAGSVQEPTSRLS